MAASLLHHFVELVGDDKQALSTILAGIQLQGPL
jgi:hypothetical protein